MNSVGALLGAVAAGGALLAASAFLWPASEPVRRPSAVGRVGAVLRARLVQAGMRGVTPGVFVAASLVAGAVAGLAVWVAVPVAPLGAVAAVAACTVPFTVTTARARRTRRALRAVWPDVVDHLVSAARAGLPLPDGLSALAGSGPPPVRAAFAQFSRDYTATADFGHSIDRLKLRLADAQADRILETVRMAREIGGTDLVAVLRSLSAYLRREATVRAEVEARQSWIVNAARVGAAAPWIVLLLLALRPEAVAAYDSDAGLLLIAAGFVVTVIAYRIMLAFARLPEERRWFA